MRSANYKLRSILSELKPKTAIALGNKEIPSPDNLPMFSRDYKISELPFQWEVNKHKVRLQLQLL